MLKIPGVSLLSDYTYSIGITNNKSVMLTVKYSQFNSYNYLITKFKIIEFFTDQRCGTINLLFDAITNAMNDSLYGKAIFSKGKLDIYLTIIENKKIKDIPFTVFTGFIY